MHKFWWQHANSSNQTVPFIPHPPSEKTILFSQKFAKEKIFRQRSKFLSHQKLCKKKQVSVTKSFFTEISFCNRNKPCPHACPLQLKVFQNLFLLFLARPFCNHFNCHLNFFLEQRERATFADLKKAFLLWELFSIVVLCVPFSLFCLSKY